jgi:hypothetical protein
LLSASGAPNISHGEISQRAIKQIGGPQLRLHLGIIGLAVDLNKHDRND